MFFLACSCALFHSLPAFSPSSGFQEAHERLEDAIADRDADIARLRAEGDATTARLEKELREAQARVASLEEAVAAKQAEVTVYKDRVAELERGVGDRDASAAVAGERLEDARHRLAYAEQQSVELRERLSAATRRCEEVDAALARASALLTQSEARCVWLGLVVVAVVGDSLLCLLVGACRVWRMPLLLCGGCPCWFFV